jgi:hypothetical protein
VCHDAVVRVISKLPHITYNNCMYELCSTTAKLSVSLECLPCVAAKINESCVCAILNYLMQHCASATWTVKSILAATCQVAVNTANSDVTLQSLCGFAFCRLVLLDMLLLSFVSTVLVNQRKHNSVSSSYT